MSAIIHANSHVTCRRVSCEFVDEEMLKHKAGLNIRSCHTRTSHVTHERVMSHTNESCHTRTSHVTYEWAQSFTRTHTWYAVMSHVSSWMSHTRVRVRVYVCGYVYVGHHMTQKLTWLMTLSCIESVGASRTNHRVRLDHMDSGGASHMNHGARVSQTNHGAQASHTNHVHVIESYVYHTSFYRSLLQVSFIGLFSCPCDHRARASHTNHVHVTESYVYHTSFYRSLL